MNSDNQRIEESLKIDATRRAFFSKAAGGIGGLALGSLLGTQGADAGVGGAKRDDAGGLPGLPHYPPKAKRVIYLLQNGAPSHVDLFDWKPKLREWHGKQIPDEIVGGRRFSTMTSGQTTRPVIGEISGEQPQTIKGSLKPAIGASIGRIVASMSKIGIALVVWIVLCVAAFWP